MQIIRKGVTPNTIYSLLVQLLGIVLAMLLLLRAWVGLVAVMAAVNAVQCFLDPQFPQKRIYTLKPDEGG